VSAQRRYNSRPTTRPRRPMRSPAPSALTSRSEGTRSVSSNPRTAAVVVVIVAFVAGILVGVAGDHLYLIHKGRLFPRHAARFAADRMADRLSRDLELTPQQKTQVQQIIEKHRAKIDATMSS